MKWVEQCISTISFSILLNESPTKWLNLKRGLHQSDHLSPYLFILCFEILLILLFKAKEKNKLHGVNLSKYNGVIPHLMFADNIIAFLHANVKEASCLCEITELYEK